MAVSTDKLNDLQHKTIAKILYFARSERQVRVLATVIENFLRYLPELRIFIALIVHILTIWIAYRRTDNYGVLLTATLPVLSELYWLYFLQTESLYTFFAYLFVIVSTIAFISITRKLETVGFSFSYKFGYFKTLIQKRF